MKLNIPASLLTLALTLGSAHIARAEDPTAPRAPQKDVVIDRVVQELEASGVDKDTIAKVRKSIEDETRSAEAKSGSANEKSRVTTSYKIVVGPDGKVQQTSSEDGEPSLKKVIADAKAAAGKSDGCAKVSGKAVIIGPDGQKKEIKIDDDGAALESAVKEAIKDASHGNAPSPSTTKP